MATYLLDTGVIIDDLNQKRNRPLLLGRLLSEGHLLACCSINVTETYAGMRPKEEGQTEALLQSLRYYPVTFAIARLAGLFKRDYSKKGQTLSIADTIIAAVAIHHGLPLITDNTKDFPMKQLQLHTLPQA
jgi:predicted nucleic acid-binding protein